MKKLLAGFSAKNVLNAYSEGGDLVELTGDCLTRFQKLLLDMVLDIAKACEENGITFFLCGGSALGAVRHGGFIPWDDDFDIAMSRSDYERFKAVFEKAMAPRYSLNAPNYSEQVITRFPKVLLNDSCLVTADTPLPELQKVFVDIFILDNIPANKLLRMVKGTYCNILEFIAGQVWLSKCRDAYIINAYRNSNRFVYGFKKCVGILFSYRSISRWNDKIDKAVQYSRETGYVGFPTGRRHYFGEIFEKSAMMPDCVMMTGFEGKQLPILKNTSVYLEHLYGDYMQIPPPEKRERHFVSGISFQTVDENGSVRMIRAGKTNIENEEDKA